MTALELYKFVEKTGSEYHWIEYKNDTVLFIHIRDLEEWNKLLGSGITDEEGITCIMKDRYFVFWMQDICDYFDIEINEIFDKENEQ